MIKVILIKVDKRNTKKEKGNTMKLWKILQVVIWKTKICLVHRSQMDLVKTTKKKMGNNLKVMKVQSFRNSQMRKLEKVKITDAKINSCYKLNLNLTI